MVLVGIGSRTKNCVFKKLPKMVFELKLSKLIVFFFVQKFDLTKFSSRHLAGGKMGFNISANQGTSNIPNCHNHLRNIASYLC